MQGQSNPIFAMDPIKKTEDEAGSAGRGM